MTRAARAVAHANIALIKYWGKLDVSENLPAVPSLSMTLDSMSTVTSVGFGPGLAADRVALDGRPASDAETSRVVALLDRVREASGIRMRAWVESANDFPTASGLASSASGFAALALAACAAAGLDFGASQLSDLARRSSASAARSIFGGFVTLAAGTPGESFLCAEPLLEADSWKVALCVAVTTREKKAIGSTEAMKLTARTSPYYPAWVESAPSLFARARQAVLARDLQSLGELAERSALAMHACAMASDPPIVYFGPTTLAVMAEVRALRKSGTLAYFTMDAGPHVKVLCAAADVAAVTSALARVDGVEATLVARPGPAASVQLLNR